MSEGVTSLGSRVGAAGISLGTDRLTVTVTEIPVNRPFWALTEPNRTEPNQNQ